MAFYDGRVDGYRFAPEPNWVDDGALSLGIASYALVEGDEALIYDTHVSVDYARSIRDSAGGERRAQIHRGAQPLASRPRRGQPPPSQIARSSPTGARRSISRRHKAAIEAGTHHGPPAIDPLILPTRLFDGQMQLKLGGREFELIELNIHSDDATVIWLPQSASCWPATRWRTRSPTSASPRTSTAISKTWNGCGRSTRPSSCQTMATRTLSRRAAIPKCSSGPRKTISAH